MILMEMNKLSRRRALAAISGALLLASLGTVQAQTFVRDLDNPARQPFQVQISNRIIPANASTLQLASVPQGKRLVIEHVSLKMFGGFNDDGAPAVVSIIASLRTQTNGAVADHLLTVNRVDNSRFQSPRSDAFVASQELRAYADPETQVSVIIEAFTDRSEALVSRLTISGYFVDVP